MQVTLNRPTSANALSSDMVEQLIDVFSDLDGIRLCVIKGNGKHFCAGFDLSGLEGFTDADLLWRFLRIEHLLQLVHYAPIPVLALAQGRVVGAGADLFAASWQRVATPDAVFNMPGWNFEIALGTRRLTNLLGSERASDILLDCRKLDAPAALECHLATDLASPDAFDAIIEKTHKRAGALSPRAVSDMLALTRTDTRDADFAAIVRTAGRPGLKDRVVAYRERAMRARAASD